MGKLIFSMMVSLDGFIETDNQDLDWVIIDEELHRYVNDQVRSMGAFLYGRRVYETMVDYWPTADSNPSAPDYEVDFARIWQSMPKIVFSRTLDEVAAGHRLVKENVVEEVAKLKAQPGKDLGLGGADLAATFRRHDLIDEYQLFVHPVFVGKGKRLFKDFDEQVELKLVDTRRFGSGVVFLHYKR